ncbi:hypothetical protein AQUCO_01200042v1 [Aquilegia coerulea]|uniref:Helitron helicase-like domain-containing protein n=1 Tax=Aquilegia coerulea TaxID=218851 RepID=A0A2G5E4T6_AQUCA|nr:hypothetical protein AQUCO_01200042v1 [Aquilegia coerulea]
MDVICPHCKAYHWFDEKLVNSKVDDPLFGICCLQGKIKLPLLKPLPPPLKALFEGSDKLARSFRKNIRSHNASNAFSSLGVTMDDRILNGRGPTSFTIHGELCHKVGSLLPETGKSPSYAQLYIYDPNEALEHRKNRNSHLLPEVLKIIQETLLQSNEMCKLYKQAFEILKDANEKEDHDVPVRLTFKAGTDCRRYNLPTSNDIAVILPGDGSKEAEKRDIVLHLKNHRLERISECHPMYLPSHYVLLFPRGELGWSTELRHWDVKNQIYKPDAKMNRLTQLEYFCYRMFERRLEYSAILRGGPLFQQFVVDAWAAYEQNKLYYLRTNQHELRAEVYSGLTDIVHNGENPSQLGKRFILPSSHLGSPRHMYEIYQDSMAITRFNKHPDIFLTATANPKWPEIVNELKPFQNALDRPDLAARVFELKRKAIMHEITNRQLFGKVVGYVYTIEFQKRGLPHMHALIFLPHEDKIRTIDQVYRIISAEFLDPVTHPALFETVKKCMVHGPCGTRNSLSSCMVNGFCKLRYRRPHADETLMDGDGYPIYRRRKTGVTYTVRGYEVDNRDVVPYNPYLSEMFDCHINTEVCASVRAVKYIHKYIYKGHDRTTMVVGAANDEIQQYLDSRYVGPVEAAWRLLGNRIHEENPTVTRLALHLKGEHLVVFNPKVGKKKIKEKADNQKSTLTEFFNYYLDNPETTPYTYQEFPQHFTWDKHNKVWSPRKQGTAIGRMYFANPNSGERFYLRLLLTVVKGPDSFESLYVVGNTKYNTYREACLARGLLEDDNEWDKCIDEACKIRTGVQVCII